MIFGYIKPIDQIESFDSFISILNEYGCERIIKEKLPFKEQIQFEYLIDFACSGDTVVVVKLEHLSSSFSDLLFILDELVSRGVNVVAINDNIDTRSFNEDSYRIIFSTLANIKKQFYSDQIKKGLENAKNKGVRLGRPSGLNDKTIQKVGRVVKLYKADKLSINEICTAENISRATLYRYLRTKNISLNKRQK